MKKCSRCKKEKPSTEFYKDKRSKSGLYSACKKCHYSLNKVGNLFRAQKKWRIKNRLKIREYYKAWCLRNPEKIKSYGGKYKGRYKERKKMWAKVWSERYYSKEYFRDYVKRRKKVDKQFHLSQNMATAIRAVLRGKKKFRTIRNILGYSVKDLVIHLEKQFDDKMSWDNYGKYWEIDHKTPKSWFRYTTPEDPQFKECWALKNLQPLERSLNRSKNNRYASIKRDYGERTYRRKN